MKITKTNKYFLTITSDNLNSNSRKHGWLICNKLYNVIGFFEGCFVIERGLNEYNPSIRSEKFKIIQEKNIFKYDENKYTLFLIHYNYFEENIAKKMVEYFNK